MRLQRGRNDSSGTYTARGQPISTPKYLPDGICPWFNPSKDCWFGCPSAWKPPILEGLEWGHALARNKFWNFKRCSWGKTFRTCRLWGCTKYLQLPQRASQTTYIYLWHTQFWGVLWLSHWTQCGFAAIIMLDSEGFYKQMIHLLARATRLSRHRAALAGPAPGTGTGTGCGPRQRCPVPRQSRRSSEKMNHLFVKSFRI